jgi:hypothetical protein
MKKVLIQGEMPQIVTQDPSPFVLVRANLRGESLSTGPLIC